MSGELRKTKLGLLILLVVAFICLCACSSNKTNMDNDAESLNYEQKSNQDDFIIEKADKAMKEYLEYYDVDFSIVLNKGIEGRYVVYETIDSDGYMYCVAIDENYNIYGGFPNSEMTLWWESGAPAKPQDEIGEESLVAEYSIDVIGILFQSYKNRMGGTYVDISNNKDYLSAVAMNIIDGTTYYLNIDDSSIVAVKDEIVVSIAYNLRGVSNTTSDLTIRDVINREELTDLFDIYPQINAVNEYNAIYSWQVLNGYFCIIGTSHNSDVYGNYAWYMVVYSSEEFCSSL